LRILKFALRQLADVAYCNKFVEYLTDTFRIFYRYGLLMKAVANRWGVKWKEPG